MQTKPPVTPWFPADVKPVRKGVYEVRDWKLDYGWFAYWDGKRFGYRVPLDPVRAYRDRNEHTECPPLTQWRGLSSAVHRKGRR